jgi:hypothetical protein
MRLVMLTALSAPKSQPSRQVVRKPRGGSTEPVGQPENVPARPDMHRSQNFQLI